MVLQIPRVLPHRFPWNQNILPKWDFVETIFCPKGVSLNWDFDETRFCRNEISLKRDLTEKRFPRNEEMVKHCKSFRALRLFVHLQLYHFLTVLKGNGFMLNTRWRLKKFQIKPSATTLEQHQFTGTTFIYFSFGWTIPLRSIKPVRHLPWMFSITHY